MARERMVTRTVDEAIVETMFCNVSESKVFSKTVKISATIPQEKALKYIKKHFDTETEKAVTIVNYTVNSILYGMTEQQFIEMATILPHRGEKE